MDQLVVLIVILLIGAWFSWRDISNGRGWMCRFLTAKNWRHQWCRKEMILFMGFIACLIGNRE